MAPREAAHRTMKEVSGALIAIGLVMTAVFVPTAFVSGISGIFYRQFAITIAAASLISLIVSLTLSPALAALLLKPHPEAPLDHGPRFLRPVRVGLHKFNAGFDWLSTRYGQFTARVIRMTGIMLIIYAGLLALTGWRLASTPTGFIPEQDQGFLIGVIQLPPGASLDRTSAVMTKAQEIVLATPGVDRTAAFAGLDGASFSQASNSATIFVKLSDFEQRTADQSADAMSKTLSMKMGGAIENANVFFIAPPAVEGLGNGGGFTMMIQDRQGLGYRALEGTATDIMGAAGASPQLQQVFTLFNTGAPRIAADVDRDRAQLLGVQPAQVYEALGTYLGSTYVNDFNMLGRTFRVTAQAEPTSRADRSDIARLQVRSSSGSMVPLSAVASLRDDQRSSPRRSLQHVSRGRAAGSGGSWRVIGGRACGDGAAGGEKPACRDDL
jgi:multidrug efflux pump subunit AcrB